jgi:hypothetical protein
MRSFAGRTHLVTVRASRIRTNSPIVLFAVGRASREAISISAAGEPVPAMSSWAVLLSVPVGGGQLGVEKR